jgi:hypothetical protein
LLSPAGILIAAGTGASAVFQVQGSATFNTTIPVVANTPYFFAASVSPSLTNILVLNIATGLISTATSTTTQTFSTTNGNYYLGIDAYGSFCLGPIAALMYAPSFMSMSQLRAWAADPWAFWYPRTAWYIVGAASGGGGQILYSQSVM